MTKRKGQEAIIGLMMVFTTILVLTAISPTLYTAVSTYCYFGSADKLIVQLFPLMIAVGILMSILLYVTYGRNRQV